jgi:predicted nucleotidyltransferase
MVPVCYTIGVERDAAISQLRAHEAQLKQPGVQHLYLFGSTARGEARDDSGVDLFFDHDKGKLIPGRVGIDSRAFVPLGLDPRIARRKHRDSRLGTDPRAG